MSDRWGRLQQQLRAGSLSRRDFMAAAAALGMSNAFVGEALAQTPKRGGHLIMGVSEGSSGDSLDPARFKAAYMNCIGPQLYDSLSLVDEKVNVRPALAESWEPKPGVKEWVFKLRKGVTFHNGKEMTPADVVYSINHHRGKDSQSAARALVSSITDIKATGPNEITVTLDSGNADLPFILADWHLAIVPDGADFAAGVGTGPFTIEKFEPGVRTLVKRNTRDWRSDRGYVESVETVVINDLNARLSAMLSGSVHIINQVAPHSVASIKNRSDIVTHQVLGAAHDLFVMTCDAAPYDNLDMRLAFKYALDRQAMVKTVLQGYGKVGNDQPIPAFNPFYAADIPQRPYDIDKAKFHYKKTGHSGPVVLTVAEVAFPGCVDMAQIFQASAKKAGIDLQVNRVPNDGYYTNVWLKNPFCATYWAGRPTADIMLTTAYLSTAPWNETHWKRPKFDEMLIAARAELDNAKRKKLYHDMQVMIYEDGGALIPAFIDYIDAAAKKIRGFVPDPYHEMSGFHAAERVWFDA